jgi:hypothetical protein
MKDIEKDDLIKNLKGITNQPTTLDMEAVDFLLLKLNEIRHEVRLKLKDREYNIKEKNVS